MHFRLWWLMIAVAVVACALGAVAAFSHQTATLESILTGWVALCGIPLALIVGRRVPFSSAARVSGKFLLARSPIALLYGLLGFAANGGIGFVGGFTIMMLVIAWASLFAAACSSYDSATRKDAFDLLPRLSPEGSSVTDEADLPLAPANFRK
jgi:hypothetical protein